MRATTLIATWPSPAESSARAHTIARVRQNAALATRPPRPPPPNPAG